MRFFLATALAVLPLVHAATPTKKKPAAAASSSDVNAAQRLLKTLPLRDRIAQLVMVKFFGEPMHPRSKEFRDYLTEVRDLHVGGFIILNRVVNGTVRRAEPLTMAAFLNRMQKLSKVPLIVGADFERGASMRMTGTAAFPHSMAFGAAGDPELTRALGRATAREARAMGVHWVFAPDADVNNNPDNPIINIRSYSQDPAVVAAHVQAYIEGAHSDPANRIMVCAKHFPGHGDTSTDTHIGLGVVTADRARLDQIELVPFRAAIAAGVDSIMTAHLSVPALEPETIPATVSKNILTDLLRKELNFSGLITTDAMDMQGLTKMYPAGEAAVRALEAGVDLLLIPANPKAAIEGVYQAVKSGRLSAKRIDESAVRILAAKVRLGLMKKRFVKLEDIEDALNTPEDEELALKVAGQALTLAKNDSNLLPLAKTGKPCVYTLLPTRVSTAGREFQDEIRSRAPGARLATLEPQWSEAELERYLEPAANCDSMVVASWVSATAYRGSVDLGGNYPAFMEQLLALKKPVVFISFGNPYLLRSLPDVTSYVAAFSTATPSEVAAARALFGEIPFSGKSPVTIR